MAITAMTLKVERWLDEIILEGDGPADVGGASLSEAFSLPAGLGDIAIMSVIARINAVATVPATGTVARGAAFRILSSDGAQVVDLIGVSEWFATNGNASAFTEFQAYADPDALVLCRQNELVFIVSPEMDINAGPTADLRIYVKAVRVRPTETIGRPIQLVRSAVR